MSCPAFNDASPPAVTVAPDTAMSFFASSDRAPVDSIPADLPKSVVILPSRPVVDTSVWLTIEPSVAVSETSPPLIMPLVRSEEHTSELQSLMRISYAVFCLRRQLPIYRSTHA